MLTKGQQKMLARYLIQLLQLQAGNASPKEFKLWKERVQAGFSDREKKRIRKAARRDYLRLYLDDQEDFDYKIYK